MRAAKRSSRASGAEHWLSGDCDGRGDDQEEMGEDAEDMKPAAPTKYAYIII